jgi:hypothetical protein
MNSMRTVDFALLAGLGLTLAACGGGSDGTSSLTLSDGLELCGLNCPEDKAKPNATPQGQLPSKPPSKNGGNDTSLSSGDDTIALEKSILISDKSKLSLSTLKVKKGKTAQLSIDTQTDRNGFWPKAKVMEYYKYGSLNNEPGVTGDGSTPPKGRGLGGKYAEYRLLSTNQNTGTSIDEELQVWTWGHSYGTQYRDVTSGSPDADHQAWSFGGKRTASAKIPTGGSAVYRGEFGSTAKTKGWVNSDDQLQTLNYNNIWRVKGNSVITADFANNKVNATLTPKKWSAFQSMNGKKGFLTVDLDTAGNQPNRAFFMDSKINLRGTITKDTVIGNKVRGSTTVSSSQGWISNSTVNPFAGAFFGPNAEEFTGIFNVEAVNPEPVGGFLPINDDRRGTLQHSGVVNGKKQ